MTFADGVQRGEAAEPIRTEGRNVESADVGLESADLSRVVNQHVAPFLAKNAFPWFLMQPLILRR